MGCEISKSEGKLKQQPIAEPIITKIPFKRFKKNSLSLLYLQYPELEILERIKYKKLFMCIIKENQNQIEERKINITSEFLQILQISKFRILTRQMDDDKKLLIWDLKTWKIVKSIMFTSNNFHKIIKLTSKKIAYIENLNSISVMDLSTSQRVKNLINSAIEGNINYLIKINESTLASANDNQTIKIWNLGSGNSCIKTFNYEVDHKICCLLKFNDSKLISAGLSIKIWDLNTSKFIKELNTLTTLQFEIKIIFKLNNTKIAYILNDRLYIWDILNDECINTKHSAVCFIELNKFQFAIVSKVNNFIEIGVK